MYIVNRTLPLCKNFLRSIAYIEKKLFCLELGYIHDVNKRSDYVGMYFIRQGVEASSLHVEA